MFRGKPVRALACVFASLLAGCGGSDSAGSKRGASGEDAERGGVNVYIWADYLAPDTVASFEKLTGIKVRVSIFETNEALESRMLTGHSGFDVVVPTAPFLQRQIRSGAYLQLDKKLLPNFSHLDPAIMSRVALNDPGNAHSVVYMWGTYGIGYNTKMVAQALPNVPFDSWRVIFDPAYAAKLAPCGINLLDAPAGVVRLVLAYLGRDPNAPTPQDLTDVEAVLSKIRPYIRTIDSSIATQALANGDICVALTYNGNVVQARNRAKEAGNGVQLDYIVPKEGSLLWFDMLAIPRDAPHPGDAHRFINYLLEPQTIAKISNAIGYADANSAALPLLDASIASDPIIFPPPDVQKRLFVEAEDLPEQARAITRIWQRFKTGQ
jgi:putrescine transport system substrate-binding protein